jgi:hypothetical protein
MDTEITTARLAQLFDTTPKTIAIWRSARSS